MQVVTDDLASLSFQIDRKRICEPGFGLRRSCRRLVDSSGANSRANGHDDKESREQQMMVYLAEVAVFGNRGVAHPIEITIARVP